MSASLYIESAFYTECLLTLRALSDPAAAARGGHTQSVQYLLDIGADAEAAGYLGMRALHHACNGSHEATVEVLLQRGAVCSEGHGLDELGNGALHYAAARGVVSIVSRYVHVLCTMCCVLCSVLEHTWVSDVIDRCESD